MRNLLAAAAVVGCGLFVLTGQQTPPTVYTVEQAAAGRVAYESTCGKCHTPSLLGRGGDPDEVPPLSSLPSNMIETVKTAGGIVPPLAGPDFMKRWGTKATSELSKRIQGAVGGFPPANTDQTTTYLNLTAYVLQVNGARAGTQELTAETAVPIESIVPASGRQ